MALNAQLLGKLKPIYEASLNGGTAFANPKDPLVKALERDGFVTGNVTLKNPSDTNQIAYTATVKAAAEFPAPQAAPTPAAGQEAGQAGAVADTAGAATEGAGAGAEPAKAARKPRGPNAVRDVKIERSKTLLALPTSGLVDGRRGPREEKYPFSTLEAPAKPEGPFDSFFIHATEAMPKPATLLAGNVTKANKKFKDSGDGRQFKIAAYDVDPEFKVAGARIFRVK